MKRLLILTVLALTIFGGTLTVNMLLPQTDLIVIACEGNGC
jgi:hypothetical protein